MYSTILLSLLSLFAVAPIAADQVYVANSSYDTVSVIDGTTHQVIATIGVGNSPYRLDAAPDYKNVYVINNHGNSISVIDTEKLQVTATIPLIPNPAWPFDLALSSDGKYIYVSNSSDNDCIDIVDTQSRQVMGTIFSDAVVSPLLSSDGKKLYTVNNAFKGFLYVIDMETKQISKEIAVGMNPLHLAIAPDNSKLYVVNCQSFDISVVDLKTYGIGTISLKTELSDFVMTPDGKRLYVGSDVEPAVFVIDTQKQQEIAEIQTKNAITCFAVAPDGKTVYAGSNVGGSISVINTATNQVTAIIPVGMNPTCLKIAPEGDVLYVANSGDGTVSVIDLRQNKVVATPKVGSNPFYLVVIPSEKYTARD